MLQERASGPGSHLAGHGGGQREGAGHRRWVGDDLHHIRFRRGVNLCSPLYGLAALLGDPQYTLGRAGITNGWNVKVVLKIPCTAPRHHQRLPMCEAGPLSSQIGYWDPKVCDCLGGEQIAGIHVVVQHLIDSGIEVRMG